MEKHVFFENLQFYLFTYLGSNMGASWGHLWTILAAIRAILGRLGAIWEALRINLGSLEASRVRLKDFRTHFKSSCNMLELFWDLSQTSWHRIATFCCHFDQVWLLIGSI